MSKAEVSKDQSDCIPVWTNLSYINNCKIAVVQCIYVVWNGGSGGLVDDFFNGGVGIPNGNGHICFWEWEISQR